MKIIIHIFRIIVGALFVFSGAVKAIDAIGTSYKLEEYFAPSVFDIHFLAENALFLSVIFVILEIILGLFLLIGYKKKFTLAALLLLIIFFSFLTFYSAYYDVVKDCGCFGDFIKLEPWESFNKDLILLIMIVVLCFGAKYINPLFTNKISSIIIGLGLLLSSYVVWHGIERLPMVDFRPFAEGMQIQDGLKYEEDKVLQIYKLKSLTNQADTLVDSDYYVNSEIWKDTLNWELDSEFEIKDSLIKKGTLPKIKSFVIADADDNEITDTVLEAEKMFLIVYPDDSDYCSEGLQDIITLMNDIKTKDKSIEFLAIGTQKNILTGIPSATLDDSTMKQMIRSNPGVLILSKGKVLAKYHYNNLEKSNKIINLFKK